jgi:transcriptional regulator with XRE-family HTH domain
MRRLSTPEPPESALVSTLPTLGRAIRARRLASGLRIDDAAALCGVSADLLSRLENGRSGVTSERLLRVLDGLGLSLLVLDKASVPTALHALSQAMLEKPAP